MQLAQKWWQFTKERFDPGSHLVMILLFVAAHRLMISSGPAWPGLIAIFLGTSAFFYKLRLYDELKDYELDLIINPTRPLARGLVKHSDLYAGIIVCILLELGLFGFQGSAGAAAILLAIAYSLLMYKEFFIREKIRPHLTTYAVSHTVVSALLTLAILSAMTGTLPWEMSQDAYLFALNSWCLFNIFEFGRKTFTSTEERAGVESYSKIFGRFGAVALVISMAGASAFCLFRIEASFGMRVFAFASCLALVATGVAYAQLNRAPFGKIYRAFSSIYIVLIYVGMIAIRIGS